MIIQNVNEIGKEEVQILPNRMYYLGHSSDPKRVLVTEVNKDYIKYVNYPYYGAQEYREQLHIAKWLIVPAVKKRMAQMEAYAQAPYGDKEWALAEVEKHKAFLNGGNEYEEVAIGDYKKYDIEVKPSEKFEEIRDQVRSKDYWYYAEQYGCVGGMIGEREGEYVINGITEKGLRELEAEGYSVIIKKEEEKEY